LKIEIGFVNTDEGLLKVLEESRKFSYIFLGGSLLAVDLVAYATSSVSL